LTYDIEILKHVEDIEKLVIKEKKSRKPSIKDWLIKKN